MATRRSYYDAAKRLNFGEASDSDMAPPDSPVEHTRTQKKKYPRRSRRHRSMSPDLYGPGSDNENVIAPPKRTADDILKLNTREAHVRLTTFPKNADTVESTRLWASNGFYINENGAAECFSCHLPIIEWKILKDPNKVHMERFPKCRFRRGEGAGNIPFNCRPITPLLSSSDDDNIPSPPKIRNMLDTPPETPRRKPPLSPTRLAQKPGGSTADTPGCSHWPTTPTRSPGTGIDFTRSVGQNED